MDRSRVKELHFITPVGNLPSVQTHGILSHNRAARVPHSSVALEEVQIRRAAKSVPGGYRLHDYANLYFDARNPMMYLRKDGEVALAVICVSPAVLDLPGVVIADGNAASESTRFAASPAGIAILDENLVYARYWTDSDPWVYWEKKRARCAEVLVPNRVDPRFIQSIKVHHQTHINSCEAAGFRGEVFTDVFFR